jgi:hypothetical protein
MATITVEDGTVVSGANSYVTTAELDAFAAERAVDSFTGDQSELLIQAMDYLESLDYIGLKYSRDQALQWPRSDVYIDGYYIAATTIPTELKNAQMQIAMSIDAGNGPNDVIPRRVKRQEVDVLEVEYADNAPAQDVDPKVHLWLKKLIKGGAYGFKAIKA